MRRDIVVLGVFVADCAFRAPRPPRMGETILGTSFALNPGGKGSNQAVAAARAGGRAHMLTKLGRDTFGEMAQGTWDKAGVIPAVTYPEGAATGAAYIFVDDTTGDNAIIVTPGVAGTLDAQDVEAEAALIGGAAVFITQLEQPMAAAEAGLRIARAGGATTILNPAPAAEVPDAVLALCDIVTPNESEAEALTGVTVRTVEDAQRAARVFLDKGVKAAVITLGAQGAVWVDADQTVHQPAFDAGPVVETTGAGDAFNGALCVALAEGMAVADAMRFACATASISVTRAGAAPSMPARNEIEALLK